MRPLAIIVTVSLGAVAALGLLPPTSSADEPRGVVVESVGGWALKKAGLQPGDVLLSWKRLPSPPANPEAAEGVFDSYFDWVELELEQAPRGGVELKVRRDTKHLELSVSPGLWTGSVRPRISAELLQYYLNGKNNLERGRVLEAIGIWEHVADTAEDWRIQSWVLVKIGELWDEQLVWDRSAAAYKSALGLVKESFPKSLVFEAMGKSYQKQGKLQLAQESFSSAQEIRQITLPERSLVQAESLHKLGEVTLSLADLEAASKFFNKALVIKEVLAPSSLSVAETLNQLGAVAWYRRELDEASDFFGRALAIRDALAPNSLDLAESLNDLGTVAWARGDLPKAEQLHRRALKIRQLLAPNSLMIAESLNNLGENAKYRGDIENARNLHEQALEIFKRHAPASPSVAVSLNNLGTVAWLSGDLDRAEDLYRQSYDIWKQTSPNRIEIAHSLNNLGTLAWQRDNLDLASSFFHLALKIWRESAPESLEVALGLHNLGTIELEKNNLDLANEFHQQALEIKQKRAPDSTEVASSFHKLAEIAAARGNIKEAMRLDIKALNLLTRLSPGSFQVAETLNSIGRLHLRQTPPTITLAADFLERSLDALEDQLTRFGGSHDIRSDFRSQYWDFYRQAMDVQLNCGEIKKAFYTSERSRSRGFLEQLAERDLVFTADIPEELDRERRLLAARFDRVQRQLSMLNDRDHAKQIDVLLEQLRRLRDSNRDIENRIRRASPKLSALQYPEPLDVETTMESLDEGTLLLSFSVGQESTIVFAINREEGLSVKTIRIKEKDLYDKVEAFVRAIRHARRKGSQRFERATEQAVDLYKILISPVDKLVSASERLLIIADGVLHFIPWHALVRDKSNDRHYLIEWKPLHFAASSTVYAEKRKLQRGYKRSESQIEFAAFGDAIYPNDFASSGRGVDAVFRSAISNGLLDELKYLPYTRYEIKSIASMYSANKSKVYLGESATEENVQTISRSTRIVHFATHGLIDQRFPLNSFLALTIPREPKEGASNGLLQAWEVLERVRIDADLVVLSACESALGVERRGEGIVGLNRAFEYAGARSVLASLWRVADQSTAELMIRFYRHLLSALPKDEALRAAQLEFIHGPVEVTDAEGNRFKIDASAPFYWAAFQIYGDWQ